MQKRSCPEQWNRFWLRLATARGMVSGAEMQCNDGGGSDLRQMNVQDINAALLRADGVELPYAADYFRMREVPGYVEQLNPGVQKLKEIFGNIEQFRFHGAKAVPEATAAEALGERPDDALPWFESLMDDCLERVDTALDASKREYATKEPVLSVSASQKLCPKNKGVAIAQKKSLPGWGTERQPQQRTHRTNVADKSHYKPQDRFCIPVDNSEEPFQPKLEGLKGLIPESVSEKDQGRNDPEQDNVLRKVLGSDAHRASYRHPLQDTLDALEYNPSQLELGSVRAARLMEFTMFVFVDTEAKLEEMAKDLRQFTELAVDLEHHDFRTYLGLTCLMQISTRKTDYVVDTLPLWTKIGVHLAPIFADPAIVKVLHGAFSDIIWLQRDFGIYMVNMFDTYEASRVLEKEKKSLAFLLETYCNIQADKKYQLADWRVRPLNKEMLMYARSDTHSLLYIYDIMRHELFHLGKKVPYSLEIPIRENVPKNALGLVLERSRMVCLQRYEKPVFHADKMIKKNRLDDFNDVQKCACNALMEWRESLARRNDESRTYILNTHSLIKLAARLPASIPQVRGILAQHDKFALSKAQEIVDIIADAKSSGKPRPGLCAPIPNPPTVAFGGHSETINNLTPKPIVPLNATPAGIFGTLVAGNGVASHADGSSTGEGILPIKAAAGKGFGAMMSGGSKSQVSKVDEINASFVLPFDGGEASGTLNEGIQNDGKEAEQGALAETRSTAHDIRAKIEEWKKRGSDGEMLPAGDEASHTKKKARLRKAWDDCLQDYVPASVKQAYSSTPKRIEYLEMSGDNGATATEATGEETAMEAVFKDTGLAPGKEDLVSAELKEISKAVAGEDHEDEPKIQGERKSRQEVVVPFDYAKAREDKKNRRDNESNRKTAEKSKWGDSEKSIFKKPRRSKTHARTNNKFRSFGRGR